MQKADRIFRTHNQSDRYNFSDSTISFQTKLWGCVVLVAILIAMVLHVVEPGKKLQSTINSPSADAQSAASAVEQPETTGASDQTISAITPSLQSIIAAKRQQNADVVGWLRIPDTNIDRVILQNPQEEGNSYYLQNDFNGQEDTNGEFCADYRIGFGDGTRDSLPMFTTLYGHSWDDDADGELFSQLKRYRNADYAKAHPYVFFSTGTEDMVWEVFAVFDTTVHIPYVWPELPTDTYQQVMDVVQNSSIYNYQTDVSMTDKILVLSTCTYIVDGQMLPLDEVNQYRFVVMAKLVDAASAVKESAAFTANTSPLSANALPEILLPWQTSRFSE